MPFVKVFDRKERFFNLFFTDNVFFPPPPLVDDLETHLDNVRDLDIKGDDVIICAYPKCGTHWVWEMVQMLRLGRASYDARAKEALMLDFMPQDTLDGLPTPRTLNSHFFPRFLPSQITEKATKLIRIHRDPRDVAVSWFHHFKSLKEIIAYEGEFADYFPLFIQGAVAFGSWFDYTVDWEKFETDHPTQPILHLYYEEIQKDPLATVKTLSKFLDVDASDQLCEDVAAACDFSKLKEADREHKTDPLQFTWREDGPGIYRKGKSGDWKNWFTKSHVDQFDKQYAHKMANTKIFQRYRKGTD